MEREEMMGQDEMQIPSTGRSARERDRATITLSQGDALGTPPSTEVPAPKEMPCPTCSGGAASMSTSFVYALGRIEGRFPRLSVEKEFAQARARAETAGKTDQQVFHAVLTSTAL